MKTSTAPANTAKRPAYYITKSGKAGDDHEYLFRMDESGPKYLIRSRNRADTLDTILTDMHARVYEAADRRQLIEALFGEAVWKYGSDEDGYEYEFGVSPEWLYPEEKEEEPKAAQAQSETAFVEDPAASFCQKHELKKHKNGKDRSGAQVYLCPRCRKESTGKPRGGARRVRDGRSLEPVCEIHGQKQKAGVKGGKQRYKCAKCIGKGRVVKRPRGANDITANDPYSKCGTCGAKLDVAGYRKDAAGNRLSAYYRKCNKGCPRDLRVPLGQTALPGEELTAFVTKQVAAVNGHDPQLRGDIVNELIQDHLDGKLTFEQLSDRPTIKRYAKSQARHYQDKFERLSLDAPVRPDEEDSQTFADMEPATDDTNPHAQLEAKEEVLARLGRDDEGDVEPVREPEDNADE